MCFDEQHSWISFVIGTVINIIVIITHKEIIVKLVCILLQWAILMQLFEGLIWHKKNNPEANIDCKTVTKLAMISNILQPIVMIFFILFVKIPNINKLIGLSLTFLYICWALWAVNDYSSSADYSECMDLCEGGSNLDLKWWNKFPLQAGFYIFILIVFILLFIRPLKFASLIIFYILVSLGLSSIIYPCGVGSVWCYFVSFAPLFIPLFWKISN